MTPTEPMFIETVSPATRKTLVSTRITAMRGRLGEACARLKARLEATPDNEHTNIVALGLLWSELLHLDGQNAESFKVFEEKVEPRQAFLAVQIQLVTTDNLSVLQMEESPREGVTTFYHLIDRRRVAQFRNSESDSLLAAQTALERDRFTEALPLLWQNLLRAHSLGSWRASTWAAQRLANLYLKVGALELACHYLILAQAGKEEIEQLAMAIARRGDPDVIRAILRLLTGFANLRRHFIVACRLLANIPDFIPDENIETVAEWLLPRCGELPALNGGGVMRAAWEVVREIGHRIPQSISRRLIETALRHHEWQSPIPGGNRVLPNRQIIIEAVTSLTHSAPSEYLPEVAQSTIALATERVQDHDYGDVINLLCNLSQLGGADLRSKIKSELYVPGKPVNRMLAQVAGFFGVEALNPDQWEQFANKVIEEIRLTVQRLKPGETPKPVAETLMTMNHATEEGNLHVIVHGGVGFQALVRGKQNLSDGTIDRLIRVLVEMATNRDNLLSNRELLLSQLCDFADRAGLQTRVEVVRVLEPLARGDVAESTNYPNSAAGRAPLASARMNMGTPQQVQAMALVAAATFCGPDSTTSRLISEALLEGFVSPHVMVRTGAYAAARRLPDLSSEQLLPVLMGLRDPDPTAATAAFAAFADRKEWSLTRPMWKIFLLATRLATQSQDVNLRRHAAIALRERVDDSPTGPIRSDADAILKLLSSDVAHTVREAAVRPAPSKRSATQ